MARPTPTPVLWLCGPPGVGKTTVAWEIYSDLVRSGAEVGYVDIDQLGMCFPEPASDPGRHRIQADNLGAVVAGYRAAGAQCVVVSGVVDPVRGPYPERIPDAVLTVCRLRADPDELARRLIARHGDDGIVAQALAEAETMDGSDFGDVRVDTTGRSVSDVVRLVRAGTVGWPGPTGPPAPRWGPVPSGTADGTILWLCGATGVGKSTAGFSLYLKYVLSAQIPGAFVDLDQIGGYGPPSSQSWVNHRMRAEILAAVWATFRAAGATCLTVVGPAEDAAAIKAYTEALPAASITVVRLHAGRDELTRRVLSRGPGGSWAQPGDPLKGQSIEYLSWVAGQAAADAEALDRAGVGDLRLDTDGRTAEEVADAVVAATGWPGRAPRPDEPSAAPTDLSA